MADGGAPSDARARPRRRGAFAGVLAAGVALSTTEVVGTAIDRTRPSLVGAVASRLVVALSGPLKNLAIGLFGVHDKAALVVGIVVVGLLVGALLGLVAARRRRWAIAGLAVFAAVGVWCAHLDPLASAGQASIAALAGVAAGGGVLWLVLAASGASGVPGAAASGLSASGGSGAAASGGSASGESGKAASGVSASGESGKVASGVSDFAVGASGASGPAGASGALGVSSASEASGGAPAARPVMARRRLIAAGGVMGTIAVGGPVVTAWWRSRLRPASASRRGTLAPATRTTPVPPGESFPVAGLTPYVTTASTLYRIDTATFVPRIDVESWRLRITGLVDRPATYTYDDLAGMDLVEEPVTIACVSNDVGGHLVGNGVWRGIPLRTLLERAGVQPAATQVIGRSVDEFTVGIPTAVVMDGRVALVALGLDGDVLPDTHGFPARLIVAGRYGYASATKWLTEIELTRTEDVESYWVSRGWSSDGSIVPEARIDVPASGVTVPAGAVTIAGVAWAPPAGVARVEVQLDRGEWRVARLGRVASPNTWVQWALDWPGVGPGIHIVAARVTDANGRTQTDHTRPPEPDGATGYPYRGFTAH